MEALDGTHLQLQTFLDTKHALFFLCTAYRCGKKNLYIYSDVQSKIESSQSLRQNSIRVVHFEPILIRKKVYAREASGFKFIFNPKLHVPCRFAAINRPLIHHGSCTSRSKHFQDMGRCICAPCPRGARGAEAASNQSSREQREIAVTSRVSFDIQYICIPEGFGGG